MIIMISLVKNSVSYIDRAPKKSAARGSHGSRSRVSVPVDVVEISAAARAGAGGDSAREDEFFEALESAEQLIDQSEALSAEEIPEKMRSLDKIYGHLTVVEPLEKTTAGSFDSEV
jgi:hypothetical protein